MVAQHAMYLLYCFATFNSLCLPTDAAANQQKVKQAPKSPSNPASADGITFPFAPSTPDHDPPSLPPCNDNPMAKLQTIHTSQGEEDQGPSMSSFHQLLTSQESNQQERLKKFQELLASQEMTSKDGQPLVSLAERVRTMAAQLDLLQKRTQVPSGLSALHRLCCLVRAFRALHLLEGDGSQS